MISFQRPWKVTFLSKDPENFILLINKRIKGIRMIYPLIWEICREKTILSKKDIRMLLIWAFIKINISQKTQFKNTLSGRRLRERWTPSNNLLKWRTWTISETWTVYKSLYIVIRIFKRVKIP